MKTLNLTLRAILLFLILVITSYAAFAYDFVVKGIYYNINGDEVTVTYMRHYTEHSVSDYYTIYDYYENDKTGDVKYARCLMDTFNCVFFMVLHWT